MTTEILRPIADGSYQGLTISDGARPYFDSVDEVTPDEDETYVGHSNGLPANVATDTYQLSNPTGSGTINKIIVRFRCKSSGGAYDRYRAYIYTPGWSSAFQGTRYNSETDWTTHTHEWVTNPELEGVWTNEQLAILQAGVSIEARSGCWVWCTQVEVVVDRISGVTHQLEGIINGVASVSGIALIIRTLAGITSGVASVSGLALVAYRLAGIAQGAASVTGLARITRFLSGLSSGVSSITASLKTIISLSGAVMGTAIVTGLLFPMKLVTRILHVRHPALLAVIHRRGGKVIREYHDLSSLDDQYLTKQVGLDVAKGDTIEATTLPGISYRHKV